MILGIGTDMVDIRRIEKLIARKGWNAFAKKILSKEELKIIPEKEKNYAAYLARRFAAKEAITKAFGTGMGQTKLHDIIILKNKSKKPEVNIRNKKNLKVHISMADEYPYAIAFAVIEENKKSPAKI